jgi:pyruvate/2-oxoglutarate dehydrogenase complex dihydrolipoamide acyltransferase (E2) component
MEPWRRVVADGFAVASRPDAIGVWLQDLLAATQFRDRYRQDRQVPLTYAPLFIKICALALSKYPQCNAMMGRRTIMLPSSIDIGIAMAGGGVLDPVVVICEAEAKPLKEIVAELREKGRGRSVQQQQEFARLNHLGRWLPSPIRRRLLAWAMRDPAVRRRYVGTFQMSVIAQPGAPFEFIFPGFLTTTLMMVVNGVMKRPVVVEDRLEIRPTTYIMLAGDHAAVGREHVIGFIREVQRLLLNPTELGD